MVALKRVVLIDVRSPCEYQAEHIPGAINVPLFTDQEREIIGTVYAREGELVARRQALRLISPKIADLVDEIAARKGHDTLVVHCWRGGLRSEAVVSCLSIVGVDAYRLTGGYKAFRKMVVNQFEAFDYPFEFVVLHGHTGVGKTEILDELAVLGLPVVDLEKLANHRGSVFGALGLGEQPSQKNFESALWKLVRELTGLAFAEAEGRKLGRISLPDFILERLNRGRRILVTGNTAVRARRIVKDYARFAASIDKEIDDYHQMPLSDTFMKQAKQALVSIKDGLGGKKMLEVDRLATAGDVQGAVEVLLADYYDRYYQRQIDQFAPYELTVCGDEPGEAAKEIASWLKKFPKKNFPSNVEGEEHVVVD